MNPADGESVLATGGAGNSLRNAFPAPAPSAAGLKKPGLKTDRKRMRVADSAESEPANSPSPVPVPEIRFGG